MGTAKAVSLSVVASQVSNLCFEVGGIVGESNVVLGASVAPFDFAAFYAVLGSMPAIPGHPARLIYDFLEIQAATKPATLLALRAEPNKAALNKAINSRANAFYAKYANAPDIISRITSLYSPTISGSKPVRLAVLRSLSENQMLQLQSAYTADGRTNVVKTTQSSLDSHLDSRGTSNSTGRSDQRAVSFQSSAPQVIPEPPSGGGAPAFTVRGDGPLGESFDMDSSSLNSTSTGSADEHQTIVNTDYGYRVPYLENLAQYERAQISLIDEEFAQFMYAQNIPFLGAVFQNELSSMDGDVYRTQIAYLNTILMSPIKGTVTGIYKNPGDAVSPGEAVVRVENNEVIYLVARLVYRGPVAIGSSVSVQTQLFDAPGAPTTVSGSAVAVRGLQEDDHWELVVQCNNLDGGGKPIFPLGYHFDYDDTTVTLS